MAVFCLVQRLLGFSIFFFFLLTNHDRSILVSIGRNVENRDSARVHTQDAPLSLVGAISSTFPYHWSITFTFCIALYRVLKMHYLLPICKERFSIHTALVFYFPLLLLFFRFHMLRSSLLYFRIPRTTLLLFVFNERWILDVRFGDDIPLFEGRQMLGFRITRRRNGLAR